MRNTRNLGIIDAFVSQHNVDVVWSFAFFVDHHLDLVEARHKTKYMLREVLIEIFQDIPHQGFIDCVERFNNSK